ncbi:MAG: MBL fold metallo-hydrolase [Ignavibacteria bacterium RBG_13_36_8]|nr:MAG: MBL fold metallo-hydrolase [Ignavibacteria bacterium RBG_13_36_8]
MEIRFIGAAKTVTGSLHLIKANGKIFLLDCGLYQGRRKEAFEINRNFEFFDPREIDFVILSHAHIDHSGNLPTLVNKGFEGKIYSTFATKDLSEIMLRDSGHIQVKDTEFVNKRRKKQGKNPFEPLYTEEDAIKTLEYFVGLNYHHETEIAENIRLTFFDAGHILGSSIILLTIKENGRITNLGFSGDLGRPSLPILKDPEKIPDVDYFICESTYGGRLHDNPKESEAKLALVVNKAYRNKSKIIVPAFSVGRTQELVYALHRIFENKQAPVIPVFVDSPLSVNATEVFRQHPECFDNEISQFLVKQEDPFGFNKLNYIKEVADSKKLNELEGPHIIISSSGMCEAGRILHHLNNNIENRNNIILIVGYSALNTLGRKIVDKVKIVKIFGEEKRLKAEVIVMNSFSAHADANELINYCQLFDKGRMQRLFIVHGDFDQQEKFRDKLISTGFNNISVPDKGDVFTI